MPFEQDVPQRASTVTGNQLQPSKEDNAMYLCHLALLTPLISRGSFSTEHSHRRHHPDLQPTAVACQPTLPG